MSTAWFRLNWGLNKIHPVIYPLDTLHFVSGVERRDKTKLIYNLTDINRPMCSTKKITNTSKKKKRKDCVSLILSSDSIFIILTPFYSLKIKVCLMCEVNPFSFVENDFVSEEFFYHCVNYHRLFLNALLHSNDKYLCLQSLRRTCLHGQSSYIEKIQMITQFNLI